MANEKNMLNKAKPVVLSQYHMGNDMPVPTSAFEQSSYHDGHYEQFKEGLSWKDIQPEFKLNVSADEVRNAWSGTEAIKTEGGDILGVSASAYDTATLYNTAKDAWPDYDVISRGTDAEQDGYTPKPETEGGNETKKQD